MSSLKDIHNNINTRPAINPAAATTDNTPWVSAIVDRAGYHALELLIQTGSLADADATFAVTLEDGDASNLSDAAAATPIGTTALASFTFADDNKCFKIGYGGIKRYVRATITPSNNSGNAFVSAQWLLAGPTVAPTPNPPA